MSPIVTDEILKLRDQLPVAILISIGTLLSGHVALAICGTLHRHEDHVIALCRACLEGAICPAVPESAAAAADEPAKGGCPGTA